MRTDFDFRSLDRTYIVAEIGVNHEGSKKVAADMIRKAAASGPDAVKFQTYIPERFVSRVESDRLARARRFALSQSDFRELAGIAAASGLTFFSTPLDPESADFLDEMCALEGDRGARSIMARHPEAVVEVPTEDEAVFVDVDDAADLERARGRG